MKTKLFYASLLLLFGGTLIGGESKIAQAEALDKQNFQVDNKTIDVSLDAFMDSNIKNPLLNSHTKKAILNDSFSVSRMSAFQSPVEFENNLIQNNDLYKKQLFGSSQDVVKISNINNLFTYLSYDGNSQLSIKTNTLTKKQFFKYYPEAKPYGGYTYKYGKMKVDFSPYGTTITFENFDY